jgi:hypothetical protein
MVIEKEVCFVVDGCSCIPYLLQLPRRCRKIDEEEKRRRKTSIRTPFLPFYS